MSRVRVRIVIEPPVDTRHGIAKGRICEVLARQEHVPHPSGYWVMGDMGKRVLVLDSEAFVYPEGWE